MSASDETQTSRSRLLHAGKTLFARNGYEQTSTASIARAAGSSESQLIRYFGGKAGLLEAIFDDAWHRLGDGIQRQISTADDARDAIVRLLAMMMQALSTDQEIGFLFLFEGRRLRGATQQILLSKGYETFVDKLEALIERGRIDGSIRADIDPRIICCAMMGCAEGLLRSKVLANRRGDPDIFDDASIVRTFTAMVGGLAPG